MIKVEKTAKTLDEEIKNSMEASGKLDYVRWSTRGGQNDLTGYSKEEQVDEWDNKT